MKFLLTQPKICSCGRKHTIITAKLENDGSPAKIYRDPRTDQPYVWYDCDVNGSGCGTTGIVYIAHATKL